MIITYDIEDIRPFVNWIYFDYAWGINGKSGEEVDSLHTDAEAMLDSWQERWHTHAVFEIFDANSDGDDIIIGDMRLPMLRQQHATAADSHGYNLCLSDFVRPLTSGIKDKMGVFACSVDLGLTKGCNDRLYDDVYNRMLSQVLADRLAEGTAEKMHLDVRRKYWGYAPDEDLSMDDIHAEHYQGIRPAVGYPSMPDTSINFLIDKLIDMKGIGIRLTESGMMQPHASVSGLMISHPKARYFALGKIGDDQLHDYARRRALPTEVVRKFLASSLQEKA